MSEAGTQLDEQLFRKYDTNGDGSISLRKFRATLEKVAQKTGSTLDVPWELVQAIWGVPERVDYVTFCSWLNPTKLHRLKQKASKLAARAVKASGEDDASFWQGLCLKHAPPAEAFFALIESRDDPSSGPPLIGRRRTRWAGRWAGQSTWTATPRCCSCTDPASSPSPPRPAGPRGTWPASCSRRAPRPPRPPRPRSPRPRPMRGGCARSRVHRGTARYFADRRVDVGVDRPGGRARPSAARSTSGSSRSAHATPTSPRSATATPAAPWRSPSRAAAT